MGPGNSHYEQGVAPRPLFFFRRTLSMRRITSIAASVRRPGRFDVTFDDGGTTTLSIEVIDRLHLASGGIADELVESEIAREESVLVVYDRALNMLALRARSSDELRKKLVQKGETAEIVDVALERLRQIGFLDDASFARQFARSKTLGAGLSKRRLKQQLARKGVAAP